MTVRYILTDYVNQLMAKAVYDKLEDGTFSGRIPSCKGVVAFGSTLRDCEEELHSTLEDWILVGLKLGHPLPVIAKINLNVNIFQYAYTNCDLCDYSDTTVILLLAEKNSFCKLGEVRFALLGNFAYIRNNRKNSNYLLPPRNTKNQIFLLLFSSFSLVSVCSRLSLRLMVHQRNDKTFQDSQGLPIDSKL